MGARQDTTGEDQVWRNQCPSRRETSRLKSHRGGTLTEFGVQEYWDRNGDGQRHSLLRHPLEENLKPGQWLLSLSVKISFQYWQKVCGAKNMIQQVRASLCKHEGLRSNLPHPCKRSGIVTCACDWKIVTWRLMAPESLLAGEPSPKAEFLVP